MGAEEVSQTLDLEFDGELLIPRVNTLAYRQIYSLEGWMRRICLTAWMGVFGASWSQHLDPVLLKTLEGRVRRNHQRLHLDAESNDDLIWQSTHHELLSMLTHDSVAVSVHRLTGFDQSFVHNTFDQVRGIRNILAHNRALSRKSLDILQSLIADLEKFVDAFRASILYGAHDILSDDDWMGNFLAEQLVGNDWSQFQAFVCRKGDFVEYVTLPTAPFDKWPDAERLLKVYASHLDGIVAFCLNKEGDEIGILAPAVLDDQAHIDLCDIFSGNPNVWTDVPFVAQHPKFICSPKVWIYENRSPFKDYGAAAPFE
ncbi:hypothetical protein AB0M43_23970 [Longispora sp. NPDC051575]|uniref:hypothetical protein n=1 Tax=Longispora sp. NPDC051575 TaxID=3154943 RepID=UPI00341EF95B